MNFIRKNKEKPNKNSDKTLDLPPSLSLPTFSSDVSVPTIPTSPYLPTKPSPLPESAPSSSSPPLYARFARGTFELREQELLSPSSPQQTLRHRSSNESGAGFRSSGVRDEVERLVVAKRTAVGAKNGRDSPSVRAPSIRSFTSDRDSPLPSLSEALESRNPQPRRMISQPTVILPRPPTPPPPSPPKVVFAKQLPTLSPEKTLPDPPSLPPVAPPPVAPQSVSPPPKLALKTPPSKTLPLSSPVSPSSTLLSSPSASPVESRRRVYSPLAAFRAVKDNSSGSTTNVVDSNEGGQVISSNTPAVSTSTSASTSLSTPTTPASTLFMSSSTSTATSTPSSSKNSLTSPTESASEFSVTGGIPASPLRNSPITGPGLTGTVRAASISKSSIRNGVNHPGSSAPEGESSPVKGPSSLLKERGYFASYPDREKIKKTIENFDTPSPPHKNNLPSPVSNGEPVTPIPTRPSKSSISIVDDDDPSLQAFVKNLPSVSRHTTGDSETSSIASSILANATFGETNRRVPRGARLSRIGSSFNSANGLEDGQSSATAPGLTSSVEKNFSSPSSSQAPSRKASASIFEETFTSKIPTASANASTSTLNSLSAHNTNSTPNTASSTRIASKSESVRERVRALEEEREREREKERLRRSTPWVRKDGTAGVIKSRKEEKESNGSRSASSSTIQHTAPQQTSSEDTNPSSQGKHAQKVVEDGDSNAKSEETVSSFTSPPPESPAPTVTAPKLHNQLAIDTQMSSERPAHEKVVSPSLIPTAIQNTKPRPLDMKPLPTHDNSKPMAIETGEVGNTGTNGALKLNKTGTGASSIDKLPTVVPVTPSPPSAVPHAVDEVRDVTEVAAVNSRLRSGSTLDLDEDPFVRGPLVRQGVPVHVTTPAPVSAPIDIDGSPNESSRLYSEPLNNVQPHSVNVSEEPIRREEPTIENPSTLNGSNDHEISRKDLPSIPSAAPVVDTIKESHPPEAPSNAFHKHHKHNESVVTAYSNESDSDGTAEVQEENKAEEEGTVNESDIPPSPPYPLERHLCHPYLFHSLLKYLCYADVLNVLSLNHPIRRSLTEIRDLREEILERFLHTVGYSRWIWQGKEPLVLSLKDLNAYLRGVSTPMHEYATIADAYLAQHAGNTVPASRILRSLAASCRSYTRLVIRLREHAEAEYAARGLPHAPVSPGSPSSPTSIKHARHLSVQSATFSDDSFNQQRSSVSSGVGQYRKFSSPLFRVHHAPLLRVYVPSPNGAWLSDESVLECEKELKRAGVVPFLRPGDVVWDTAVAEEMNAGRLVWDGSYLIDLDYSYTLAGELPRYLHSLSFPPSYFHKVIQANGNPLCQIDISPWGVEIINNVQLVQDKAVTITPQGAQHPVLRWIHRSHFQILPGTPIPDSDGLVVNSKWIGTVVVETEGTNEGLGNLLGRCGEQVAARAETMTGGLSNTMGKGEVGRAFRLIRSKSQPGEIWLRCVSEKEKLA